jgi:hypothetical protein
MVVDMISFFINVIAQTVAVSFLNGEEIIDKSLSANEYYAKLNCS